MQVNQDQVNQDLEASEMDREEKKPARRRLGWIVGGLIVSLIASVLYVVSYGGFERSAKTEGKLENPLETQETAAWLMEQTYVIYHDLMQSQSSEELGYEEIYVKPREGCEWILDEWRYSEFIRDGYVRPPMENDEDMDSTYNYLQYLREN